MEEEAQAKEEKVRPELLALIPEEIRTAVFFSVQRDKFEAMTKVADECGRPDIADKYEAQWWDASNRVDREIRRHKKRQAQK